MAALRRDEEGRSVLSAAVFATGNKAKMKPEDTRGRSKYACLHTLLLRPVRVEDCTSVRLLKGLGLLNFCREPCRRKDGLTALSLCTGESEARCEAAAKEAGGMAWETCFNFAVLLFHLVL